MEVVPGFDIDRVFWTENSNSDFRLNRNPTGVTYGDTRDFNQYFGPGGPGENYSVYILIGDTQIEIPVTQRRSIGPHYLNLTPTAPQAAVLQTVVAGMTVEFAIGQYLTLTPAITTPLETDFQFAAAAGAAALSVLPGVRLESNFQFVSTIGAASLTIVPAVSLQTSFQFTAASGAANLTVVPPPAVAPAFADDTGNAQSWTVRVAITDIQVPAATGTPIPTYAVVGSLPAGIIFDPATRVISGIPADATSGSITIRATNGGGFDDWTVAYATSFPPIAAVGTRQPQLQVIFDSGRFRWADFYDSRAQTSDASAFVERLFPQSRIIETLPDPFRTVHTEKTATISCHNTLNAEDNWENKTISEIEALHSAKVTFNEIARLNQARQRRASVTLRDLTNFNDLMSLRGFLTKVRRGVSRGSFDVVGVDRAKLKTKIPTKTIKDAFENSVEYDSATATESVRIVFGQSVRLRVLQITSDQSTYGPISLARGSLSNLTIQTVYRDGMVVPTTQYETISIQGSDGETYGAIRFIGEDVTANDPITAPRVPVSSATQQSTTPIIRVDVLNAAFAQNHANAIKWALEEAGFRTDATSFNTARNIFSNLNYVVGGAITRRRNLDAILKELLVRGSYVIPVETGANTETETTLGLVVDAASRHDLEQDVPLLWTNRAKSVDLRS